MKNALFLLIVILSTVVLSDVEAQKKDRSKIDSLFAILKTPKEDTGKVNTLNALANEFANNNPDTAIYFANEALALSTKLNYKMGIADAYLFSGRGLRFLGKYKEQLKFYNEALKLYNELQFSTSRDGKIIIMKGKGNAYNSIGLVNYDQGNWPEGLKNYFTALRIFEEIRDKRGIAMVYSNIGNVYYEQGNFAETLKNHLAALKINEELGDKRQIAGNLNNIGMIYDDQDNYPEALKNYLAALKLNEELGNKQWLAINLNNIGNVYLDQGNYHEALKNHFAALKIYQEFGYKDQMATCFNNIGVDYTKLKNNSEAIVYLNRGVLLAKEIGSFSDMNHSYNALAELDSSQGNFKKALEHFKMYIATRDSMYNEENTKKTVRLQMQYEFDKKESIAKIIAQKELQKQKLIRNGFMGGSAMLLIFAVILFILKYQYEKIRLIKKERNRISGELHDDIGAELTRITVISQLLYKKPEKDADMQEKLLNISEAGNKVLGSISEIIWTMNPQKDNLESLVAHIRRFAEEYLEMNGIEVNFDFPDEIPARSVSDEYRRNIFLVIKEAVNNITKYAKATRVKLSMTLERRTAGIEIHDNGTGFSLKEKQNWGNGLRNMDQRMKDVGGNFQISSVINQGTLIRLNFPVR
jgi:two-component system, NarL family, sensor histidine kinase UhpB